MLLFDNEENAREFSAAELQRSKLSPSATSLVNQRAQSFHKTSYGGQGFGASITDRFRTSAIAVTSEPVIKEKAIAVSTTSEPVVRDHRTADKCPVGEVYDRIEQMCIPGPSQAESGLTPGLQPFVPKKISAEIFTKTIAPAPVAPTRVAPSPAPAPVIPDVQIPRSVVSTTAPSQGLVQKGVSPLLTPLPASAPSRAAEPAAAQASLVSFKPEETGFLDKSLIGGFKVKHALIGTGVLGVLGAGFFALRGGTK